MHAIKVNEGMCNFLKSKNDGKITNALGDLTLLYLSDEQKNKTMDYAVDELHKHTHTIKKRLKSEWNVAKNCLNESIKDYLKPKKDADIRKGFVDKIHESILNGAYTVMKVDATKPAIFQDKGSINYNVFAARASMNISMYFMEKSIEGPGLYVIISFAAPGFPKGLPFEHRECGKRTYMINVSYERSKEAIEFLFNEFLEENLGNGFHACYVSKTFDK